MIRTLFVVTFFLMSFVVFFGVVTAQEGPTFCQDQCTGRNRCDYESTSAVPGDPNYNDPCCQELAKTGSAYACAWPQRGYCTDSQCNAITGNRERCGGPRHSWCNKCIDNNCPGYSASPSPTTVPPPPPTPTSVEPIPTEYAVPTIKPTTTPIRPVNPFLPFPTVPLVIPTSESFQNYNQQPIINPEQINFPNIQLPQFKLPSFHFSVGQLNQITQKPLGFFEYLFDRVTYYDRLLESTINSKLQFMFMQK